jgi:hypothetical protein
MFESFSSFGDYIRSYDLERAEGLLLRHINGVFKVLAQTVPDSAKTDAVNEMEIYLSTMIRQIDSSLLEEWKKMRDPSYQALESKEIRPPGAEEYERDITHDAKTFTALVRTRIFAFLSAIAKNDFDAALEIANGDNSTLQIQVTDERIAVPDANTLWSAERLQQIQEAYHSDHGQIRLDPNARNIRHTYITTSDNKKTWKVEQMIIDLDNENDWIAEFEVDLVKSRDSAEVALQLIRFEKME